MEAAWIARFGWAKIASGVALAARNETAVVPPGRARRCPAGALRGVRHHDPGRGVPGFEVKNADGAFVGPWGVLLHFPDLARPLGEFVALAQKLPGISERARQVVILTIGARFNVAYELYAHTRLAERAALDAEQIAAFTVLMGWFTAVSLTLMAFDLPSNAVGLDQ